MVGGLEGIGEEGVLDVGEEEFLMLLFVMEAEDEAGFGFWRRIMGEEGVDGGVDVVAVVEDLGEGGPGEGGAELFAGLGGDAVVVAVEEPEEIGMEGVVAGREFAEDEGLKEPGGVGEVPFGGAGLGCGLDHHVLWRERLAEGEGLCADRGEPGAEVRGPGLRGRGAGQGGQGSLLLLAG